jgi:hypothetical protein
VGYEATWPEVCALQLLEHRSHQFESRSKHGCVLSSSVWSCIVIGFAKGTSFSQLYRCLPNDLYVYKMGGRGPNLPAGAFEWMGVRSGGTKVAVK